MTAEPLDQLVACPVCARQVPDGAFCGACGAHLAHGETAGRTHRRHAYAADPDQHILHPSIISTLLPHLPHRRRLPFQVALGITTLLLIGLGAFRLTGPSIAVAALAVPFLYLLYLYEVEVYEDEPVLVIGLTMGVGIVLGAVWAQMTGAQITRTLLQNVVLGTNTHDTLVVGVLLPLLAQVLMLVGALLLYPRQHYREALDGFAFGAAGALGFTLATTVINLWPTLRLGMVAPGSMVTGAIDIVQRGMLAPLINASLTGLITGTLWLRRGPIRRMRFHQGVVGIGTVLIVVIVLRVLLGLSDVLFINPAATLAASAAALALILPWVRIVLHQMLLTEAVEVTIGPEIPCSHCHHIVPRMAFCPQCGIATLATPKTGSGRMNRRVRY